jgi:hypothetical protein
LSSIVTSNPYAEALGIGMLAERGWALTVIVVLNALQAAAAVAALLLGPKAQTETTTGYEAYVDYYNEAVRNYYSQQARSAPPEQAQRSAQGQAYADAQAAAQARRTQRPSQYGDYAELDYTTSRPGAPSQQAPGGTSSAGMPNVGHTQRSADRPQQEGDQSAWPGSPA